MSDTPFSYTFTEDELKSLIRFLRKKQNDLPQELYLLYSVLEKAIYDSMSVEEAEEFFL
ncbi:MAG: hypothetical protein MJ183_07000 [Treponemataceae bacterium]|nr:hypothetical protein [Treponemataceae bacterium]